MSVSEIGAGHYLILSAILFCLGLTGVLLRRNMIVILMSIELMLNAVNLAFVTFSYFNQNIDGQIMVLFVMAIAAAEAAVGLAIAVSLYKKFKELNISFFEHLRG
ncbi:MAG: NADH-quinone oxidoreductase subunit NuoK [Bdellovibrionaceae bacterium]|nr:NADH-quinone oxidoreductase subunit NuoK [Pseudobdellovibrionaceae bacterium]